MILARMVFKAKFGKGGELAQNMAASLKRMPAGQQRGMRLLTDLSGPFDTVVVELILESMAAWEQGRQAMFTDPGFQTSMAGSRDLIASGYHEFYTIEMAA